MPDDYRKTPKPSPRSRPSNTASPRRAAPSRLRHESVQQGARHLCRYRFGRAAVRLAGKFDCHTGWPSFTKPIEPANVAEAPRHGMLPHRGRSNHGDSHLGHVFDDGPRDRGGLRYCINSASLRFVARDEMEAEGYGAYRKLFEPAGDTASSNGRCSAAPEARSGRPRRRRARPCGHTGAARSRFPAARRCPRCGRTGGASRRTSAAAGGGRPGGGARTRRAAAQAAGPALGGRRVSRW